MFSTVMVPVDLAHSDRLAKALDCAAMMARAEGATLVYVGVSAAAPSSVAHTPEEYAEKLAAFAAEQGRAHGVETTSHAVTSHDPATDLDPALLQAVEDTGADLVVMASHIPNVADHIWPSNGGTIATRAKTSVLVVRD